MKFWSIIVLSITILNAQTNLTGTIGGMTLEQSGNPFIIGDNLTIPEGRQVTIKEGCVFLFNPFTGIIVQGSLIVEGKLDNPVVFTCINDHKYNQEATELPNPFDWNGILITPKAEKVKLSNFELKYSVYGVKSQKESLVINNGTFKHNGQFHLTVKDIVKPVVDDIPFSIMNSVEERMDENEKRKRNTVWVKPAAIGTGIAGIASLGAGAFYLSRKFKYEDKYSSAKTQPELDRYISKQESYLRKATVTGVIGGILLPAGITTYLWYKNNRNKNVALYPVIGPENGFAIEFKFQ